jgi:endonuclease/exonuclease/phosphatase family metal-dependent hydrolase
LEVSKKEVTSVSDSIFAIIFRISERHNINILKSKLYNDIEINPGPSEIKLQIVTLNCRGLGNTNKFRLTLKKAGEIIRENPHTIIMLQETMIQDNKYINLAWRGTYAITYGTGNSQGCLTLAKEGVAFTNQINIGDRGHYVEVNGLLQEKVTVINVYAPNGYDNMKRTFFREVLDLIENIQSENVILAGDFNLTFGEQDRHKRNTCNGEKNIAKNVAEGLEHLNLKDAWQGQIGMTWKRGATMSRLDRIYTRLNDFRIINITTDWTVCNSDHAMVKATYIRQGVKKNGPKVFNLNPQVVLDQDKLTQLRSYLLEQLAQLNPDADPHLKLEFAKMSIRMKSIELGKKNPV